ncbi:MAG: hypothetical protein B7Y43_17115 [Sphingomonas sp. 28-62-20]|nr:MAG: hypothetical protein B7Y43_17115 [Sphingomonas sp. 28-62-20]
MALCDHQGAVLAAAEIESPRSGQKIFRPKLAERRCTLAHPLRVSAPPRENLFALRSVPPGMIPGDDGFDK